MEAIEDCGSNIKLDRILRDHTLNVTSISSYISGLIEGDDCIYVPKNLSGIAQVVIAFTRKDFPLALLIQKVLNCGNIYKVKGKNAYTYVISNIKGLMLTWEHQK